MTFEIANEIVRGCLTRCNAAIRFHSRSRPSPFFAGDLRFWIQIFWFVVMFQKKLRAEKKNQNIFFVFFIRNEWVPLFSCMGRSQCSFAGSFVQLWMRFCVQHRHKAWTMAKQKTIKHLISMNYIENSIWVVLACSVGTRANVLYT